MKRWSVKRDPRNWILVKHSGKEGETNVGYFATEAGLIAGAARRGINGEELTYILEALDVLHFEALTPKAKLETIEAHLDALEGK